MVLLQYIFQINKVLSDFHVTMSDECVHHLEDCFKQHEQPFMGLETQHLQYEFYKKNFNLIVSVHLLKDIMSMVYHIYYRSQLDILLETDEFGKEEV